MVAQPSSVFPKQPRALIFDLDGTLIDSREDIAAACNHVLEWSGRAKLPMAEIAGFVGDGARTLLARAYGLDPSARELEAITAEFVRYYAEHPVASTRWMPGARELIERTVLPLALVTNKARTVTMRILDELGVTPRFGAVIAGGDGPLKPSPEPLRQAVRALGVTTSAAWMIGDGIQDIGAAHAAGCVSVAVIGGFHTEASLRALAPDIVISSLTELPEVLARADLS